MALLLIPLFLIGFFVALPFVLMAFAFDTFIQLLPSLIAVYVMFLVMGFFVLPLKPIMNKYAKQLDTIGKIIGLIFFGPLVLFLLGTILALPFVLIYSLSDNPIQSLVMTFAIIFAVILINVIYYKLHR
ncbi:hypothetical protein [Gallibacterium genomosp. 1]|uniref:Uncharacterized protein n=1 Tax=Gallibacterium genomosp. 1 TaxID=155515 RepID=A0A0A2XX16_9PAST|nr:hypothetical protein [Gallibacterium genomosp. 1]KGQ36808.1 hypothetical protein JP36_08775 [Gallibacterium genomosp. 1]